MGRSALLGMTTLAALTARSPRPGRRDVAGFEESAPDPSCTLACRDARGQAKRHANYQNVRSAEREAIAQRVWILPKPKARIQTLGRL